MNFITPTILKLVSEGLDKVHDSPETKFIPKLIIGTIFEITLFTCFCIKLIVVALEVAAWAYKTYKIL